MQLALRERQGFGAYFALWALLTVLCALAGPFGTHEILGLPARSAYWAVIVAISIGGSVVVARIMPQSALSQVAVWAGYTVILTALIFGLNAVLFPPATSLGELTYLLGVVSISVLAINGVLRLALKGSDVPTAEPSVDAQLRFLRRIPIEVRGPLVRIEAQDHYLNVVTTKGTSLILLRLAEAVEELEGAGGLQTHRSHWVKLDAVQGHTRTDGRDMLKLSDGASVPVARTRRNAAKSAGLF